VILPTITIYRGLPGSGKSTAAERAGHEIILEADQFFVVDGEYRHDPQKQRDAQDYCLAMARFWLYRGRDIAVANTFVRQSDIDDYIWIARKYGATVKVVKCSGDYGSIHGVPDSKIARMRLMWERVRIPPDVDGEEHGRA
jgi:predicted kinase